MQRRYVDSLRRYLEHRRRALSERPRILKEFLYNLVSVLGDRASIVVFGGRAVTGIESDEPRDLDLLIVVDDNDDPSQIEEIAYSLKPKNLPIDIVVARRSELRSPIARQMLRARIVIHDPLHIKDILNEHYTDCSS